jgi:hypothetical protein
MPRFYIEFRVGSHHVRDAQGHDFPDASAALHNAIRHARRFMKTELGQKVNRTRCSVLVADGERREVASISFTDRRIWLYRYNANEE